MRTIIIHHLQVMWDRGLRNLGTDFETELEKVVEHLREEQYSRVIVTNFEANFGLDFEQEILQEFNPVVYEYMYGWELDTRVFTNEDISVLENGQTVNCKQDICWTLGGNHSDVVIVDDWMKELQGDIFICGAFDGECIEDLEIALEGAGKDFKRINELIN